MAELLFLNFWTKIDFKSFIRLICSTYPKYQSITFIIQTNSEVRWPLRWSGLRIDYWIWETWESVILDQKPFYALHICLVKNIHSAGLWWLMSVILATPEAEISRIVVWSGLKLVPGQIVHKTLSRKYPSQKRAGGMAEGVGPQFKP
jgi:hypothetical protein